MNKWAVIVNTTVSRSERDIRPGWLPGWLKSAMFEERGQRSPRSGQQCEKVRWVCVRLWVNIGLGWFFYLVKRREKAPPYALSVKSKRRMYSFPFSVVVTKLFRNCRLKIYTSERRQPLICIVIDCIKQANFFNF